MPFEDTLNLASFLGEQLCNLHLLPLPPLSISNFSDVEQEIDLPLTNGCMEAVPDKPEIPAEWNIFIRTLIRKKKDLSGRLSKWYFLTYHKKNFPLLDFITCSIYSPVHNILLYS